MITVKIKDLKLRATIGVFDWEREIKQDLIINVASLVNREQKDEITSTLDYKSVTKKIIAEVESSNFQLIETLAEKILEIVLSQERVLSAKVEVDKPGALRFADSVSVVIEGKNE